VVDRQKTLKALRVFDVAMLLQGLKKWGKYFLSTF
jgi:hypothetical protein